jgi:hypothetical protein
MEREAGAMRYTLADPGEIEDVLCRAKQGALARKVSVEVALLDGVTLARVYPDGHIDATWAGSRFIGIVPSEGTEAKQ